MGKHSLSCECSKCSFLGKHYCANNFDVSKVFFSLITTTSLPSPIRTQLLKCLDTHQIMFTVLLVAIPPTWLAENYLSIENMNLRHLKRPYWRCYWTTSHFWYLISKAWLFLTCPFLSCSVFGFFSLLLSPGKLVRHFQLIETGVTLFLSTRRF